MGFWGFSDHFISSNANRSTAYLMFQINPASDVAEMIKHLLCGLGAIHGAAADGRRGLRG